MKMEKNWLRYIVLVVWVCLVAQPVLRAEEEVLPVMEMSADRVTIYPQRMELNGEETLFDILQLYPAILTNAYDNWLDDWEIRIDNGPYGGDMRVLLNEMKAYRIKKVQISDAPGVAKGLTGTMRVVDVFMMPLEEGVHGTIGAELSQNVSTTPFAELRYGSKNTDILANASYNFVPIKPYDEHKQYSNFHMVNQLGEKDQLVTYFTQAFERTRGILPLTMGIDYARCDDRLFYGQLRNYHYFKPEMFLMSALVYYYGRSPRVTTISFPEEQVRDSVSNGKKHIIAAVEEFNATFFNSLNLMAGVEADYGIYKENYFYRDDSGRDDYEANSFLADLYVELDYTFKKWRFTVGDRLRYQRLYMLRDTYPDPTESVNHYPLNLLHASVIYTPHREHQIQLAYLQQHVSPIYMQALADVTYINELKLAYNFARPNVSAGLNAYYYNYNTQSVQYHDFLIDASARYHYRFLTINGGVNVRLYDNPTHSRTASAAFNLAPVFDIPFGMQLKARTIFYTSPSSLRRYNMKTLPYDVLITDYISRYIYRPVYGELQFTKFWPMVDLYALWHDIFNGSYGIATLGLRVKM